MMDRLIIGNKLVRLKEVDSTNDYLKHYVKENSNVIEGLTIWADNQYSGKGQRGNYWESEPTKNLTFSIYLKPKIEIGNQFIISKIISLSILELLTDTGIKEVSIKWPNDIYIKDKKVAGILIENTIQEGKVKESVVGIGLNVNQLNFNSSLKNPTSLIKEFNGADLNLKEVFDKLLNFIDKNYVDFKATKIEKINLNYLSNLYGLNKKRKFSINGKNIVGSIRGITEQGKLIVFTEGFDMEFNFNEIKYNL